MEKLVIRRMQMANHPMRGDIVWALFELGELGKPLRILTDYEVTLLVESIEQQRADTR